MGLCGACGAGLLADAAYCIRCGARVESDVLVVDLGDGSDARSRRRGRGRRRGGDGRDAEAVQRPTLARRARSWLLVLGVGAAVAGAGWRLSGDGRATGEEPDDDRAGEAVPEPRPPDHLLGDDESVSDEDDASLEEGVIVRRDPVEGEPFLGRTSGLMVLAQRVGGRMVAVDLDRSAVRELETRGEPVAVAGDHVVLRSSPPSTVPLADLGADPVPLGPLAATMTFTEPVVVEPESGVVWLQLFDHPEGGGLTQEWRSYDPATGTEVPSDVGIQGGGGSVWQMFPGVVQAEDGSVWLVDEGEHRHLTDGGVVAVDWERALISRCEGPGPCRDVWFDLVSGEPLEGLGPPEVRAHGRASLIDGEVLAYETEDGRSLVDLTTGETLFDELPTLPSGDFPGWRSGVDLSPDGRYLGVAGVDGGPVIHDRDTGETFSLASLLGGSTSMVLVPADEVGGLP